jgi:hypothetical protein
MIRLRCGSALEVVEFRPKVASFQSCPESETFSPLDNCSGYLDNTNLSFAFIVDPGPKRCLVASL